MAAPGPLVSEARSLHGLLYSIGMLRADASLQVGRGARPRGYQDWASPLMDR